MSLSRGLNVIRNSYQNTIYDAVLYCLVGSTLKAVISSQRIPVGVDVYM